MIVKDLYIKGSTHSPVPLDDPDRIEFRIIADENMAVTKDGIALYSVIDADSAEGWYEVPYMDMNPDDPSDSIELAVSRLESVI